MTGNLPLPASFADLAPLCADWCLADSNARSAARVAASMDEIRSFYDALVPHAEKALSYLSDKQLGQLDAADSNLLKLLLALAEIGPAVEWFGQPRVIDGYEESKFPLVVTLDDIARQ
ncbi:MAG: hypothetical protein O7B25_11025 [Gammaproteobacteria bacterium]|nr:hypothetical protein [Gammaproteobacteria bacterium]